MCRLLFVKTSDAFDPVVYLRPFAALSKNSKEFQGHGWGFAAFRDGQWDVYKNICPVWEDDLEQFKPANLLVAHARSAFRDEGIVVENNMPFYDGSYLFIFNGELQGVKIKAEGRIGAEKVFNFIKRFYHNDMNAAIKKAIPIIKKRSRYVRAMNFMLVSGKKAHVASVFSEDPDYFTLWSKEWVNGRIICSDPFPGEDDWKPIANEAVEEIVL